MSRTDTTRTQSRPPFRRGATAFFVSSHLLPFRPPPAFPLVPLCGQCNLWAEDGQPTGVTVPLPLKKAASLLRPCAWPVDDETRQRPIGGHTSHNATADWFDCVHRNLSRLHRFRKRRAAVGWLAGARIPTRPGIRPLDASPRIWENCSSCDGFATQSPYAIGHLFYHQVSPAERVALHSDGTLHDHVNRAALGSVDPIFLLLSFTYIDWSDAESRSQLKL